MCLFVHPYFYFRLLEQVLVKDMMSNWLEYLMFQLLL